MAQADFTRISSNIAALNTLNSLRNINSRLGKAQLRLATGRRINQASDDPAGLTIALKMNARKEGLTAALGNIGDAKNMLAVAESGLTQISDILTEMKAKATAAATETLGIDERAAIKGQIESLAQQIDDIVKESTWNDEKLLGQWAGGGTNMTKNLQTGADMAGVTTWTISTDHRATEAAGLNLATISGTNALANGVQAGDSFKAVGEGGVEVGATPWLNTLSTGSYEFEVLARAFDDDQGFADKVNGGTGWVDGADIDKIAAGATGTELASGIYKLTLDDVTTDNTNIGYTITDTATGVDVVTMLQAGSGVDISGGNADLEDAVGTIGVNFTLGGTLTDGNTVYFEYVHSDEAKVELNDSNGYAMGVDASGADETGVTDRSENYFYATTDVAYDTGRGIKVTLSDTFANVGVGETTGFDFTAANTVSVALASADQASTFMGKIDTALTTVTTSLNGIGSLVARLDSKEQATSVAVVNTEAAYNRIMNADMAHEQVEASKYQILQQTAIAMLAQSNMAPQGILSLFR